VVSGGVWMRTLAARFGGGQQGGDDGKARSACEGSDIIQMYRTRVELVCGWERRCGMVRKWIRGRYAGGRHA